METLPLLTILIAVPAAAALVVAFVPQENRQAIRTVTLAATVVTFAVSLVALAVFTVGDGGFQLTEQVPWIPAWGITYRVGIDGLSLFLVLLTTFIMPLVVLAAWEHTERPKGFFTSLLVMEAAMVGVFVALDLVLFYLFFEIMLVPMYALIGIWGSGNRRYAAFKFFLYTVIGGLLMLVAIFYLYFAAGGTSFDYDVIRQVSLTTTEQTWLFLGFFAAFAIKVPLFPFHTWLPDAHTEAPTVGSVILAAILLKIGGYGFLRFSLPLFPEASVSLAPWVLALGLVGVLYGALVAMLQRDIKRLIAYSSVAHLGFVMIGVFAFNTTASAGSVVQMVNHGITTGALFLLVGFLYDRTHSREIADYSGLLKAAPVFGGLFLVTAMSSVALPGLNGFVGEFPILLGAYQTVPWVAVLAAFGVIFAALYLLWAYQRMFHGPVEGKAEGVRDLSPREIAVVAPLIALMIGIGLYPQPLYDRVNPTVEAIISEVEPARAAAEADEVDGDGAAALEEGRP